MKILLLGSDGFLGKNLKYFFIEKGIECLEFSKKNNNDLKNKIKNSSFIIHLADKIKSNRKSHFDESLEFTKKVISEIKKSNKKKYLIYASSINSYKKKNLHYNLKRNTEKLLKTTKYFNSIILKLPNIFGIWCKPNYNSFFATCCHNISANKKVKILSKKKFALVHVSDFCDYIFNIIKTKKIDEKSFERNFINLSPIEIKDILMSFKKKTNLNINKKYNLDKDKIDKIFSTYLYYNQKNNFVENFKKIKDFRGDFAELIKNEEFGQISMLTVNQKKERGNHFHINKIEKFIVVSGKGRLIHQNILNNKVKTFNISESENKIYSTIPGWSHKIVNRSKKKLIILIWANEVYNRNKPDTIKWKIK